MCCFKFNCLVFKLCSKYEICTKNSGINKKYLICILIHTFKCCMQEKRSYKFLNIFIKVNSFYMYVYSLHAYSTIILYICWICMRNMAQRERHLFVRYMGAKTNISQRNINSNLYVYWSYISFVPT